LRKIAILLFVTLTLLISKDIGELKNIKILESTIESSIKSELSLYTKKSFNINVKIYTVQKSVSKSQINNIASKTNDMVLPGIYIKNDDENSKLKEDSVVNQEVDHIVVTIILDNSIDSYTQEIARNIAIKKADISQRRGDKVIIKKMAIEKKNNINQLAKIVKNKLYNFNEDIQQLENKKEDLLSRIVLLEAKITNIDSTFSEKTDNLNSTLAEIIVNTKNELDTFKEKQSYIMQKLSDEVETKNKQLYYWLIFISIALLVIVYLGFLYSSNRSKHMKNDIKSVEDDVKKNLVGLEDKLEQKLKNTGDDFSNNNIDQNMINDLATLVIARKDGIKQFIIENLHSNTGKEKVSLLVNHVGMKSIETMFLNNPSILNEVVNSTNGFTFKTEEINSKINLLYNELLNYTNNMYKNNKEINALSFLDKLSIEQLLLLLEGEDMGIKAFIISQTDKEKSAEIFERLPEETRLYLYMEIANIKPMNEKEYNILAQNLSKKIINLPQVNRFIVDGESEMVDRIRLIDPLSQKNMLNILMTQNVSLYQSITNKYIFFKDIITLDDELLKKLIFDTTDEILALSLLQIGEDEKNKFLALLNERKMVTIDDKIRFFKENPATKQQLSNAQYQLTLNAQNIYKTNQI